MYTRRLLFFILFISVAAFSVRAQSSSYEIRFLKAKMSEAVGEQEVLVLFEVTAGQKSNFPPAVVPVVYYTLGDKAPRRTANINKDEGVRLLVYGKDIALKAPLVYSYVKDKIDLTRDGNMEVLAFYVKVDSEEEFDKMNFTVSLAEKRNRKLVMKREYAFPVAQ